MFRVFEGAERPLPRVFGPIERGLLRGVRGRPEARADLAAVRVGAARLQRARPARHLRDPAAAGRAAVEPAGARRAVEPTSSFNTAASFTTNTNWQGYVGESDDELPHARWPGSPGTTSSPPPPASRSRSRSRAGSRARCPRAAPRTIGNFWVDLTRATVYILLPLCDRRARSCSSRQGVIQNLAPYREVTTLEGAQADDRDGAGRLAGGDQAARHQRRRLLQRQRRAPLREPDAAHELPLDAPDLRDPGRAHLHVRAHGARPAPGLGALRGDGRPLLRRRRPSPTGPRAGGNPALARARASRQARQHGGQGGPLRRRQLRALRHRHDRRLVRRGQRDARQLHPARRAGAALQHPARRGRLRRRRRRPLRHAGHASSSPSSSPGSWSAARPSTSARRSRRAR